MTDSLRCPRCQHTTTRKAEIKAGYCASCGDTTCGLNSRLAFEEFVATGRIPMWRRQALEDRAVRESVSEAVEKLKEHKGDLHP